MKNRFLWLLSCLILRFTVLPVTMQSPAFLVHCVIRCLDHFVRADRFGYIVERSEPDRFLGGFDGGVAGNDHYFTVGPTVFDGYLGSGNENVFTSDGWFRTGDLVEICGEPPNYYRIVGRCKDIINRGGMKISPAEIDVLLEGHPAIAEAAVCAYPDENLGERVCACIVVATDNEQPSLADLNDYLLQQGLAKFKLPERLMVLPGLPRNALGKVQRNELQTMVSNDG